MNRALTIFCILAITLASIPAMPNEAVQERAHIRYMDADLWADTITGALEEDVEASGNVLFRQADGRTLTGDSFTCNFETRTGLARNASLAVDNIYFRGKELKAEPGRYTILNSRFTTCDKEDPHYCLSARELEIEPGKSFVARDISMRLLGSRILTIPKYTADLGPGAQRGMKLPTIGISGEYGAYTAYEFDISDKPRTIGGLDIRLSTRQAFEGGILYDQLAGRPVFARLTHRQPFYGGGRPGLLLSRLPELGIRFCSGRAAQSYALLRSPLDLSGATISPLQPVRPERKLNVIAEIGVGRFTEEPDRVSSDRADLRAVAWLEPVALDSRTVFSPGVSARFSHYGTGDAYDAFALRLAVARRMGANSFVSLSYITNSVHGGTPFQFDKVELREEIAGKLRVPLGDLTLELGGRYDIRNPGLFDTEISVAQKFHCLEPKITWRSRFKEFSFGIGLVGF